ncbi:hypothetical protein N7510_001422 [Penicillium lagena]|uniref:uncharacterized protein n=1 Tax=Penicillium lagena TaxID=94218 RepID=UPI0025400C9C|nr:uncharacterized protein N7510_001422 [Penicillium lagena]KAJ5625113.1 hypothetical protein N7510_001422 [Penicillium lagena]
MKSYFGAGENHETCPLCRARKKRCYHLDKVDQIEKFDKAGENGRTEAVERAHGEARSEANTRESSLDPSRVTIYNPESVLNDLSESPESASGVEKGPPGPTRSHRGHIQSQEAMKLSSLAENPQRKLHWYKRQRRSAPPKLSDHHRKYLEDAGAFFELPRATTDALLPMYISVLDDLIPIMDGARVFRDYSNGQSSPYLVKAICLVACKMTQAAPFLRMNADGPLMEPLEFASRLLAGLNAAVKAGLETDRIIKIQVLALMHLHTDGLAGMDRASSYLSQAICEAWSLSLHVQIPGSLDQDQSDLLWWSLRNFDRVNKPITGAAPFLIDDTDIGIERTGLMKESYRSQIMEVSLRLGDLMVTATKVYKASCKAAVDQCQEFLSLPELTSGTDYDHFHRSHKEYLEIWYHVAAMLSCRYSGPGSVQYNRRLASADRIVDLTSCNKGQNLPPLPLVPYAMSMALTVIYRALRDNQLDTKTAYDNLLVCCNALEAMNKLWTSTKRVVQLAKRLLKLINKPGVMNSRHSDNINDHLRRGSETGPSTVTAPDNSSTIRHRAHNGCSNAEEIATIPPGACQPHKAVHNGHATHSDERTQQTNTTWLGSETSHFQLDKAIFDLFDDSLPIAFQDPATLDYIHFSMNENSYSSNNFQFCSNFGSPDLEYGDDSFHADIDPNLRMEFAQNG